MEFFKENPFWTGAIAIVTAVIGAIPMWWPLLVKDKTIPEWLHGRWPAMNLKAHKGATNWIQGVASVFAVLLLVFILISLWSNPGRFQCEITDNPSISEGAISGEFFSAAIFNLYVLNNGPQSIAWKWKCTATLVGGSKITSDASQTPLIITNTIKRTEILENSNYLPNALLENPLAEGAGKDGWVLFRFPRNISDDLKQPGVEFTIQFENKHRSITTVSWTVPVGYGKN